MLGPVGGGETACAFALSRWTGSARVAGYALVGRERLVEVRMVDVLRKWVTTR